MVFFCLSFIVGMTLSGMQSVLSSSHSKGKIKILMEYADSIVFEKENNPDIYIMRGNVRFRHNNIFLFCDSAYFYQKSNLVEAFHNVRIEQGDTLFIYGNYLIYDGNMNLARIRENVRMENRSNTLFTNNLDYDRNINLGYFFDGGTLVDSVNELTAIYGQYSPITKIALFKNKVIFTNPRIVMHSDTLKYNSIDKTISIVSPTILESDSNIIRSMFGLYNTKTKKATLYNRSIITSKDQTKTMTADTLFYNCNTSFGEAFGHMVLNDTARKLILTGNYGYYDGLHNLAFVTDSAQCIEYSHIDSLFLHADTLQMLTIGKGQKLKAYYGVRIFRKELQGVCDSLQFNTEGLTLYLFKNPIIWNTDYQLSGDSIRILFNDSTIEQIYVRGHSFAFKEIDTTYFDQIKGKYLTAFFSSGELSRVEVEGSTESIFYSIDEKGTKLLSCNKTESAYMTLYINNCKPTKIWWRPEPKSDMFPISSLNYEQKFMKDFVNYNYLRPKNKEDIFLKN